MNVYAISHRRNALRALTDTALLERADELNRQLTEALANDWDVLPSIRHELNDLDLIVLERTVTTKRLPELDRLDDEHAGDRFRRLPRPTHHLNHPAPGRPANPAGRLCAQG